ncbi:PREDICTED: uncharacterized protein LOC109116552 [Tarenaya hassleriana]|uniref:uncharacterized protein LOC109116552 n=1 Tax=Tarenaya hassleriana TaxID=28532 RepID=UPI0008FD84CB|nr:PREDICTED: uncharacterized protein LOC109116552 [Tarenaya hassleriana]
MKAWVEKKTGNGNDDQKVTRFDRCLSFMEIKTQKKKTLEEMDSFKLKEEIRRWAKRVAAYARQLSSRIGNSARRSFRSFSSSSSSSSSSKRVEIK